jgi:hypothetical protein
MGLLARALRPSRSTHGSPPPCSSLLSLGDVVPMVSNLVTMRLGNACALNAQLGQQQLSLHLRPTAHKEPWDM